MSPKRGTPRLFNWRRSAQDNVLRFWDYKPSRWRRFLSRGRNLGQVQIAALGVAAGGLIALAFLFWPGTSDFASTSAFACGSVEVLDGDTLDCDGQRVRLHGIDAPELPGHCRSTENLRLLAEAGTLHCTRIDTDHYGRTVAQCSAGGADLSCSQIASGHAIRRYGTVWCGFW
jgi:endonuclease YncB( thermonuclease family)